MMMMLRTGVVRRGIDAIPELGKLRPAADFGLQATRQVNLAGVKVPMLGVGSYFCRHIYICMYVCMCVYIRTLYIYNTYIYI